jgi:hypothetical protein
MKASILSPSGVLVVLAPLAALAACSSQAPYEPLGSTASAITSNQIIPRLPPLPEFTASTVPRIGDVNPYGIAFVPDGFPSGGAIAAGDVIVANFNNRKNLQGTGTTVVKVNAGAKPDLFYRDDKHPGFSTALGAMAAGFVFLGNVPSANGSGVCNDMQADVGNGSLMIIDKNGKLVTRLTDSSLLAGPWDLTVDDQGSTALVFVSNVKNGTVTRVNVAIDVNGAPSVTSMTQVASDFQHRCDAAAFVVGPTGLAYDHANDILYVASTFDNSIYSIAGAGTTGTRTGKGTAFLTDSTHFHGPLGMVLANNGDLITAQGDAVNTDPNQSSEIVESASTGFIAQFQINPGAGSAFGVALVENGTSFRFAAVDDGSNIVDVWSVQ